MARLHRREGLAREADQGHRKGASALCAAAARFSDQTTRLRAPPLEGLLTRSGPKLTFLGRPCLNCGEWVLLQQAEDVLPMAKALDLGEDPGWRWTRMAIARLLTAGLSGRSPQCSEGTRSDLVKMIATSHRRQRSIDDA